jgi:methylglutaconyl-CoA hydratase
LFHGSVIALAPREQCAASHSSHLPARVGRYNLIMPALLVRDEGQVRILSLNRPEVRNALDRRMRRELATALEAAEADDSVRALVLTGSGTAFCAGMDLGELESLLELSREESLVDSRELGDLFMRIYSLSKPVVAAVNGHAVAGGAGLASVCDVAVMSEDARLGYTEARIGFVAALVSVFLVRLAGERVARELLLEARLLDAREALALGLVNELRPKVEVLGRAVERARAMAHNSPMALAATKSLLVSTSGLALADALRLAAEVNANARGSGDLGEGIRAFLEKRPPSWAAERSPEKP